MGQVTRIFFIELRRYVKRLWAYRMDTLGDFLTWLITFPILMALFQGVSASFATQDQIRSLIGFLLWTLCMGALNTSVRELNQEMREGTLESLLLAPVAPIVLVSLRVLVVLVYRALYTLLLAGVLMLMLRLPLHLSGESLLLLLLTVSGTFGVSLCLGGFTFVYKAASSLIGVISLLAVLATGALVPLNSLGPWFLLLKVGLPITWGIDAIRLALVDGATWHTFWLDGTWLGLSVQSLVFLLMGVSVFRWGLNQAKTAGTLGSY